MKALRWTVFFPLAFAGTFVISAIMTFVAKGMFPDWLSWFPMFLSGIWFVSGTLYIGLRLVPTINYVTKWSLIAPLILIGITGILGGLLKNNVGSIASALGVCLYTFYSIRSNPEKLRRIYGKEDSSVISTE